jgi:LPXTG-site transpeptidase (sortase) family protein
MTTDASGGYLFSGLPAGDYIARVVTPNGTVSTIDSFDLDDNTTTGPNVNTDNNDNGQGVSDGVVTAGTLTMTAGDAGAKGNNAVNNVSGTTTNPTVDFGFTTVYALGNRVWFDTNNDSVIDNGEVGVDGITVELYAASDLTTVLATDTTANGGYYLFNYLEDGNYIVVIPASNFGSGAVLDGYWSSATFMNANGTTGETTAPGPDNDLDSDDNGTLQTAGTFNGAVVSSAVTLGPGAVEPDTETDLETGVGQGNQPNAQANMTVDFGFYTIQQGDLVWNDTDNSGTANGTEVGIPGVDVQLWSADGNQLLSTSTTDASGIYTFTGLPQGDYILRIPSAEFEGTGTLRDYVSSTGPSPLNLYEPAPDADLDTTDSDDNGSTVGGTLGLGGYIQSETVTLTPVLEGSYDNSTGSTTEFRVDFGVYLFRQSNTSITKDDGQSFYLQGDVLTYTIVVSNAGPSDVTGAQVSDPRPAQIASWAWACTNTTGGASGCDGVADTTSDFLDTIDLPINSSITYTVTANVDTAATGDLVNTATITVPVGVSEIDTTDISSTDTDTFASLNVIKSDNVDVAAPGYTLTYNILVENTGNVDLSNITMTDTLPDDVTYQSASLAPDSNSGGVLVWNGLSITAGSSYSIDVVVRVNDTPVNPVITNRVEAMDVDTGATSSDIDTDTIAILNDKTIVTTNVNKDTNPRVLIGEVVTYQISLTIPHGTLPNLQALDVLDEGLAFDECLGVSVSDPTVVTTTLAGGFADACPADAGDPDVTNSGHSVVFDFGDVTNVSATDQIITVQYTADVLDIAANVDGVAGINNGVTWTWNGGLREASAPPLEIVEPNLSILKDASPSVALLGSTITFTIDIEHTDISKANAYDVVVTDQLPSGLEYIGNVTVTGLSYDRFNYDTATSTITFEWDTFPLLANSSITFEATFVGPPPVVNEASVAWTSIPLDPGVQSNYNPNSTERFYDPLNSSGVNNYGVTSSVTINRPALPKTGFAPGRVTALPAQPKEKHYQQLGELTLEIPRLGVRLPIVGVPASAQGWDLTWLSNQAGWLEGTAYPTLAGNTGLTGHTYLADGTPGPFVNLGTLYWGDQVYIHADGNRYTYEVREVRLIWPQDVSVLRHEDYDWITLITCRDYNEEKDDYTYRVAVRAVLVKVEPE